MATLKLAALLSVSFIRAAFGGLSALLFFSPLRTDLPEYRIGSMVAYSAYIVGPAWMILAVIILHTYRKRGLWVLFGAPFALSCSAFVILLVWACATGRGCL